MKSLPRGIECELCCLIFLHLSRQAFFVHSFEIFRRFFTLRLRIPCCNSCIYFFCWSCHFGDGKRLFFLKTSKDECISVPGLDHLFSSVSNHQNIFLLSQNHQIAVTPVTLRRRLTAKPLLMYIPGLSVLRSTCNMVS